MEKDLARHVIRTAFRTTRELSTLLGLLKQHVSEEEYRRYARGIASAIDAANVALLDPTYASHPEVREEVEASIDKYDRFL
jgi:hypothetical protein